jgi:hypothetical protein
MANAHEGGMPQHPPGMPQHPPPDTFEEEEVCTASSMAHEMLAKLRKELYSKETAVILMTHPYLKAAAEGRLTKAQRQAFAQEHYHLQWSNAVSFGHLAGLSGYRPQSLSKDPAPMFPSNKEGDMFAKLLRWELSAAKLLPSHLSWTGLDEGEVSRYEPSPTAQTYPSYLATLALQQNRAGAAAACAVSMPVRWGLCSQLHTAYNSGAYGEVKEEAHLAFVEALGTPITNLDDVAAAIIVEEKATYADLAKPTRLLQYYELLFWDSLMEANATAGELIEMTLNNLYTDGYAAEGGYTEQDYADDMGSGDGGYFEVPAAKY